MIPNVDPAPERVAAAVIRAWIEPGDGGALKVRITSVGDVDGTRRTVAVASDVEVACAIVREWLERFVKESASAPDRRRAS